MKNKTPNQKIGEAIRARRLILGLSQEALSERMKMSYQQIQKYEKGCDSLTLSRILDMAQALEWNTLALISAAELAISYTGTGRCNLENMKRLNMLKPDEHKAVTAFLNLLCRGRKSAN